MRIMQSFRYAARGIITAYREERQMKVHTAAAVMAVVCGIVADLSRAEWAILALTIAMVITLELVNTAVERVVDMVTEDYHPLAEKAKDIAAGAVLAGAITSVIVGICLFGTRVIEWMGGFLWIR
ncbi:MAG: diacylglycerol kinase family protein [Selenomonadales bacterium]|nr:diacylglycerol kinase family protein [Selenomonadales bacterium]